MSTSLGGDPFGFYGSPAPRPPVYPPGGHRRSADRMHASAMLPALNRPRKTRALGATERQAADMARDRSPATSALNDELLGTRRRPAGAAATRIPRPVFDNPAEYLGGARVPATALKRDASMQ